MSIETLKAQRDDLDRKIKAEQVATDEAERQRKYRFKQDIHERQVREKAEQKQCVEESAVRDLAGATVTSVEDDEDGGSVVFVFSNGKRLFCGAGGGDYTTFLSWSIE